MNIDLSVSLVVICFSVCRLIERYMEHLELMAGVSKKDPGKDEAAE